MAVIILISITQPLIWGRLLSNIFERKGFIPILELLIGVALAQTLSTYIQSYISAKISNGVIRDLREDLYSSILNLPIKAFDEIKLGEIFSRLNNDIGAFSTLLTQNSVNTIVNVIKVVAIGITIFVLNGTLALIVVFSFPFSFLIFQITGKILRRNNQVMQKLNDHFFSDIQQSLFGIREITSLGIKNDRLLSFNTIVDSIKMQNIKMALIGSSTQVLSSIVTLVSQILVIGVGAYDVYKGVLSVAHFIAFISYANQFSAALLELCGVNVIIQQALVSLERIFDLMNNNLGYHVKSFGTKSISQIEKITFENVEFEYSLGKRVLNGINFSVLKNSMTAIVGRNGSGKSTILDLLLRFYDPVKGKILINGIGISDLNEENITSLISIIRQEPQLFNMSIKENLQLGTMDISEQDIHNACKATDIHDYIMCLPKRYDTIICENSINFSIGQRQRIVFARTLLRKTPIILLDEPTSALDNESLHVISKVIKDLARNRIVIVIAHRLSTIIDSDNIIVLNEGEIIGQGTHDSLLLKNTVYYSLYEKELQKIDTTKEAI